MNLAALCDMSVELKMAPFDAIRPFSVLTEDFQTICGSPQPPAHRSTCCIGYVSKTLAGNSI